VEPELNPMARFVVNPLRQDTPDWGAPELSFLDRLRDRAQLPLHQSLPGYAPTPLRSLDALAAELGIGELLVKDESSRFGLGAFKGLGASFAVYSVLAERWRERTGGELEVDDFRTPAVRDTLGALTFTAATDGNHGRAVAWTARMLGQRAVIFMPDDTVPARIAHIEGEGAEVRLVSGTFDDCVRECADEASAKGWQVIADTAYLGYLEIPGAIMTGYATIFGEIDAQLTAPIDAMFLPAGVGGLAGSGTAHQVLGQGPQRPSLVCVEPEDAACFLESIERGDGRPATARGELRSLMAGLNCGRPSLVAWPIIRDGMDLFLAIEDRWAEAAMRAYHRCGIVAGESGAAALAGLLALFEEPALIGAREFLDLGPDSRVLVINTEGATDPEGYRRVVGVDPSENES
jgi:diaminopropionate ammonia-lyase